MPRATHDSARPSIPPRTAKGRATRQRIVAGAAHLMYERGVARTSLDDVKAAAGVSSSQLYHYFEDKAALVGAVIEHQTDAILDGQQPHLASLDSIAALHAWRDVLVRHRRRLHCAGGCPIGSLASELSESDPRARAELAAGFRRWEASIQHGLQAMRARGELGLDAEPNALAVALLAAVQGGILLSQIHRSTAPLETAVDTMIAHIASFVPTSVRRRATRVRRTRTA